MHTLKRLENRTEIHWKSWKVKGISMNMVGPNPVCKGSVKETDPCANSTLDRSWDTLTSGLDEEAFQPVVVLVTGKRINRITDSCLYLITDYRSHVCRKYSV